jgi:hypothetical protein
VRHLGDILRVSDPRRQAGPTLVSRDAPDLIRANSALYYRAKDGPRTYLKANMPVIHGIFFEFKEFMALFTLPLTVVAAFVLWYYGAQVLERRWMRYTVAIVLALSFFYLVVAFGLGAAVTKLRPA